MSPLALLKAYACLVVIFCSPWISLVERSRSSFALVVSYVQVRSFFLFPTMLMRDASGRSKPMRVGHRTEISASANSEISFEASFGFKPFVYLKRECKL
jgi:hypothetical protein